ncbi:non-homologous end joining protein Ku [Anatilimnocola floriformis]|uniref:non-homologous end joining protein Ku n=1 Tax=Anatilimnocola floriformis TaxID=2948575 RepID=UPI0020C56B05|nr:Ku protein [Anatilimnocola floriformis]
MAKKSKTSQSAKHRHRASWKGNLSFGLVSFAVEAFNAINREQGDIHFHQLHAECHRRIQYQKVCPMHGEVSNEDIVSGYEYRKGKYVEIAAEELEAIKTRRDRALSIDTFVEPSTVDPVYFDGRMYYLMPAAASASEPYAVMVQAMTKENRYGVGSVVMFGKEQLAMVRAVEGVLHLVMLNFDEEIRAPQQMKAELQKSRPAERQVSLARALIRNWFKQEFDFTKYDDEYMKRVSRLIKSKVAGKDVVAPKDPEPEPDVINLMEALKRSVETQTGKRKKTTRKRRAKRSA